MASDGNAVRRIQELGPSGLAKLFNDIPQDPHTRIYNLAWQQYGPVAQVRKTFADIRDLMEDIARRGMISMQVVFAFTPDVAARYVETTNLLWGMARTLSDMTISELDGVPMYFILVAGERRHRALTMLWRYGCRACKKSMGRGARNGECFRKHFPGGYVPVSLKVGYTPDDALKLQLAENTHKRPKAHEEAAGFRLLWEVARLRNPEITIPEFAHSIGHPTRDVSRGLLFMETAPYIQEAVAQGRLSFSAALAFGRYHAERQSDGELRYWFDRSLAEGWTSKKIQEQLVQDLKDWKTAQLGLFGTAIMQQQQQDHLRRTYQEGVWRVVQWAQGVLLAAIVARREGRIGLKDSPFTTGGIARAIVGIYEMLAELAPIVRKDLTEEQRQRNGQLHKQLKPDMEWLAKREERDDA